jgi:hypothetical protein
MTKPQSNPIILWRHAVLNTRHYSVEPQAAVVIITFVCAVAYLTMLSVAPNVHSPVAGYWTRYFWLEAADLTGGTVEKHEMPTQDSTSMDMRPGRPT